MVDNPGFPPIGSEREDGASSHSECLLEKSFSFLYPLSLDLGPHSMSYLTTSRKLSLLPYGSQNIKASIWLFLF